MQGRSDSSWGAEISSKECTFCQRSHIATSLLKETPHFWIVADHAPLLEGHILIIPRHHYACYGDVPTALDTELFALKCEVKRFFDQFYAPIIFWEHGIFRQTIFHAHLHCFPFGNVMHNLSEALHERLVHSQDDIRDWYTSLGHYFYLEEADQAFLFAPRMDNYVRVIQEVLWSGVVSHTQQASWRSAQQRREEGLPLIEAVKANWRVFQQQEVNYAY